MTQTVFKTRGHADGMLSVSPSRGGGGQSSAASTLLLNFMLTPVRNCDDVIHGRQTRRSRVPTDAPQFNSSELNFNGALAPCLYIYIYSKNMDDDDGFMKLNLGALNE